MGTIRFSTAALLERAWALKKSRQPLTWRSALSDFPGLSKSVLMRALTALQDAGAIRGRHYQPRGRRGRPARYWRPSKAGQELLRILEGYRDQWEALPSRDIVALACAVRILQRLDDKQNKLFPEMKHLQQPFRSLLRDPRRLL